MTGDRRNATSRESAEETGSGTVEIRFGVLGALRFRFGDRTPVAATREVLHGPPRAGFEELALAIARALEDEARKHGAEVAHLGLVYGEETLALIGGGRG